jgi:hypothetical protein
VRLQADYLSDNAIRNRSKVKYLSSPRDCADAGLAGHGPGADGESCSATVAVSLQGC